MSEKQSRDAELRAEEVEEFDLCGMLLAAKETSQFTVVIVMEAEYASEMVKKSVVDFSLRWAELF